MVEIDEGRRRFWTLPGGGIEYGEDPSTAAVRELAEETLLAGVAQRELLHCDASGPHWFISVTVSDNATAGVGTDPELPLDRQEIVSVAWRPLLALADDRQIALLNAALGPRWWGALPLASGDEEP